MLRDLSLVQGLNAEVNALKSRMREIFDLASVAIWISEGEQIVFANRACEALFGCSARTTATVSWADRSIRCWDRSRASPYDKR